MKKIFKITIQNRLFLKALEIIPHQKAIHQKKQVDITQQLKINQQELNKKAYKHKVSNSQNAIPEKKNHLIL